MITSCVRCVGAAKLYVEEPVDSAVLSALMASIEGMRTRGRPAVNRSAVCEQILPHLHKHLRAIHEAPDDTAAEWAYLQYRAAIVSG